MKVIRFEEKQTKKWYLKYFLVLAGIVGFFIGSGMIIYYAFSQQQTFDLFTLIYEDPEIISEYWKDTLYIIWEESPQMFVIGCLLGILGIIVVIAGTRKYRGIIAKKQSHVAKYKKHMSI